MSFSFAQAERHRREELGSGATSKIEFPSLYANLKMHLKIELFEWSSLHHSAHSVEK